MANSNAELIDYSDTIGSFVFLSQKGQLFSLNGISISANFSKLAPRMNSASFHVVYPLVSKIKPSNIVLVIHPGERGQTYFLMDIKTGPFKKSIKVYQETVDIIGSALEENMFPIIHLGELQKATLQSHKNQTPLSVPIRHIELRESLPLPWGASVKDLFVANAEVKANDKTHTLEEKLNILRNELKISMFENYLEKCLWLNIKSGSLGKLKLRKTQIDFSPFSPSDAQASSFIHSLEKMKTAVL